MTDEERADVMAEEDREGTEPEAFLVDDDDIILIEDDEDPNEPFAPGYLAT